MFWTSFSRNRCTKAREPSNLSSFRNTLAAKDRNVLLKQRREACPTVFSHISCRVQTIYSLTNELFSLRYPGVLSLSLRVFLTSLTHSLTIKWHTVFNRLRPALSLSNFFTGCGPCMRQAHGYSRKPPTGPGVLCRITQQLLAEYDLVALVIWWARLIGALLKLVITHLEVLDGSLKQKKCATLSKSIRNLAAIPKARCR